MVCALVLQFLIFGSLVNYETEKHQLKISELISVCERIKEIGDDIIKIPVDRL